MLSTATELRLLLDTPHMRVDLDGGRGVVRYTRSGRSFDDLGELARVHEALLASVAPLDRRKLGLLIDLRQGPARNDPAFEEAMGRYRGRMMEGYRRVALLVKTAVGKLQVSRHTREDQVVGLVTQDEGEALRYLLGR